MTDTGQCRACPAQIRWAIMGSGKRNPLNYSPDREKGNVLICDTPELAHKFGVALDRAVALSLPEAIGYRTMEPDIPLYLSHFATCPNRGQFRGKRARKAGPVPGSS